MSDFEYTGAIQPPANVSCSAARRVFIPDAFYAADGIFQTTSAVLEGFGAYPAVINRELERYLPFLTTTKVLMAAVKAGVGREEAHRIIKEHAVAMALDMRERGTANNTLPDRLAADPRLPVDRAMLDQAVANPIELTGLATFQTGRFANTVQELLKQYPAAVAYTPSTVL
ncbi:MAG: adenylosuccinate lyase [Candidatus Saccharibacteria bacterium]|nr:adenylosuccinate lyase [Candidatus Saccharibacteria bacterium]